MKGTRDRRKITTKNAKKQEKQAAKSKRIKQDRHSSAWKICKARSPRARLSQSNRARAKVPNEATGSPEAASDDDAEVEDVAFPASVAPASKLMSKFEDRLREGHFRFLNQSLYLSSGKDSWNRFKSNEGLFRAYHQGYLQSMQHWSIQPVDVAIRWLKKQKPHQRVVDYGCGDARIGKSNLSHDVTSLDLVALDPRVIACDMAHSPLKSASQDIAVFSLSLMGTDYHACLRDAARVLKLQGILWIAEVCSRFATASGKEDYHTFFDALEKLGFERLLAKKPSPLFVVLVFKKVKDVNPKLRIDWPVLKPCLYKKR